MIKKLLLYIFVVIILLFGFEYLFYLQEVKNYNKQFSDRGFKAPSFLSSLTFFPPKSLFDIKLYECDGTNNCQFKFRQPEGTEYKNSNPVVLFGCSYAHGDRILTNTQTFGYKLAHQLKRTVYNRAIQGKGLAETYFQTINDDFYKSVPKSDTVIYIFIDDQYRRMLLYKFNPLEEDRIKFNKKGNNLVILNYKNPIMNFIRSTHIASGINDYIANKNLKDYKFAQKLTDIAALHFIKMKEALENHWNNKINFIVIFYDTKLSHVMYPDILKEKLEKNGFTVFSTFDLTNEDLSSEKYLYDYHPTEEAWNLLTPLIIKKTGLK